MNRKLEDAMVRLAFGDVTPEEVVALEREAAKNPEAARSLAAYRRMREGLRDLYDVPEDQLSKERLRHAILTSGLKPQPSQSSRSWLWMPAAAAVLAFGFMMARNNPQRGMPQIVPDAGAVAARGAGDSQFNLGPLPSIVQPHSFATERMTDRRTAMTTQPAAGPTASLRSTARRKRASRVRHEADNGFSMESLIASLPNTDTDGLPPDQRGEHAGTANTVAKADTEASVPAQPIVLIEGAKDNDTGAQKATEVDSSKNVRTSG